MGAFRGNELWPERWQGADVRVKADLVAGGGIRVLLCGSFQIVFWLVPGPCPAEW